MSTSARQRLVRDLRKITNEPPQGINATPTDSNILVWQAVIFGPDDTPWEGGTFSLMMEFTEEYPNKPPKIRFISKVFHPNGECHVVIAAVVHDRRNMPPPSLSLEPGDPFCLF